jgi:penicillin-binding protein 2
MVDAVHFTPVVEGMRKVVEEAGGTARRARIPGISVCGKTGTVENRAGKDHSVFIAFAPMDNPQIAIAVFTENAGFGGTWSAPIASLMIEKYLNGSVSDKGKESSIKNAVILPKIKNK